SSVSSASPSSTHGCSSTASASSSWRNGSSRRGSSTPWPSAVPRVAPRWPKERCRGELRSSRGWHHLRGAHRVHAQGVAAIPCHQPLPPRIEAAAHMAVTTSTPAPASPPPPIKPRGLFGSRRRLMIAAVLIVGALVFLVFQGLGNATVYFKTADEA